MQRAATRADIAKGCAWLGLILEERLNHKGPTRIDSLRSSIAAFVIPTDEEQMIARHTSALLATEGEAAPEQIVPQLRHSKLVFPNNREFRGNYRQMDLR